MLDLARVESGTMAFHPERLCLPDLIRETIAGFRLQAAEQNITLTTDVQMSGGKLPPIPLPTRPATEHCGQQAPAVTSRRRGHENCP